MTVMRWLKKSMAWGVMPILLASLTCVTSLAKADACSIEDRNENGERYLKIAEGHEAKFVSQGDQLVAKLRITGAAESDEFLASYVRPKEFVHLVGYRTYRNKSGVQREAIMHVYAYASRAGSLNWMTVYYDRHHNQSIILSNLSGKDFCERVSGRFAVNPGSVPDGFQIHEFETSVISDDVLAVRLFG